MAVKLFIFFFQAEDGIRDAQESRGLGDVYKRQVRLVPSRRTLDKLVLLDQVPPQRIEVLIRIGVKPVSYTHLTLPTIYSV